MCFCLGHPTGSASNGAGAGRNGRSNTFAIHAAKAFACTVVIAKGENPRQLVFSINLGGPAKTLENPVDNEG